MSIRIGPLTEDHIPAVRAFNERLEAGGVRDFPFPEHPLTEWLPYAENTSLYQRPFVATDEGGDVRGGYILKRQDFMIAGECRNIGFLRLPLSEGLINPQYRALGLMLVRHAIAQSPLLYCLGMGSIDRPLPKLLSSLGWSLEPVSFFFYVVRGCRFLRGMPVFAGSRRKAAIAQVAALSGTGHAAVQSVQFLKTRISQRSNTMEPAHFGPEIDRIWARSSIQYKFAAVRSADVIGRLYDMPSKAVFYRLVVEDEEGPAGWAVMLDTKMQGSKHFGDLRVGTVVDCDAVSGEAAAQVSLQARNYLRARGVDLIVSNQSHAIWTRAFRDAGFLSFPSNYIFAASKPLVAVIGSGAGCHVTRGDGDGPINL